MPQFDYKPVPGREEKLKAKTDADQNKVSKKRKKKAPKKGGN